MLRVRDKIPVALSIAGSDSGGGAGIQADLKTFAALGVHGATAIVSVTAQNTCTVMQVQDLKVEMIRAQIDAVAEDLGINAGKTGMLHTKEVVEAVSSQVSKYQFPLVVDPVMVSKSGASLLHPEAIEALKRSLMPEATIITPNRFEAEKLADIDIKNLRDAEKAAKKIAGMGPEAVVVKGGHLEARDAVDLLYYKGKCETFKGERIDAKTTHGTGCSFSAAIAAELAKGQNVPSAVKRAKEVVSLGIRFGVDVGKGYGTVNPMAYLYRESSRYDVLVALDQAKALIEASPEVASLVPEVGMNIAMAIPYAESISDVAAIEGRIVKTPRGPRAVGNARFACSSHLAKYILEIMRHNESKRAAMNLRYSEDILEVLKEHVKTVSCYDRKKEPKEIKMVEGMTIPWGVKEAIRNAGKAPDALYHTGDVGKEPMIVVFGQQATGLARLAVHVVKVMRKR